jgi:outer membrane protein
MRNLFIGTLAAALCLAATGLFAQASTKVGIVDTMKIANESKEGKRIQSTLKTYRDQKQNEINSKEAELKALEEKIKDPKFADDKKDEYRSQYNEKMYQYQAFAKAAQDEMEGRTEKMQGEFQGKLQQVIAKYAQAKGFSLIVEKQICLYNADTLDITADVIGEMNKAYPGQ